MIKCPSCSLLSPDNSQKCDCGYLFSPPSFSLKDQNSQKPKQELVIKDIDMQFWSMVWFMVKWAFASIPAIFIIVGILLGIFLLFVALFGSIGGLIK